MNAVVDLLQAVLLLGFGITMLLLQRRVRWLERRSPIERVYYNTDNNSSLVAFGGAPTSPLEEKAICGCEHHLCFHDESGCGFRKETHRNLYNETEATVMQCGCKRYIGPEQLPKVIP